MTVSIEVKTLYLSMTNICSDQETNIAAMIHCRNQLYKLYPWTEWFRLWVKRLRLVTVIGCLDIL